VILEKPHRFKDIRSQLAQELSIHPGMSDDLKSQSVTSKTPFRAEDISRRILTIRGQKVILDADLAEVYGVSTKRLNEQVKRNTERFPEDFAFRLTEEEKTELVANCDRFKRLKHSTASPLAFTEHGAIMAASVLNSKRAVETSVYVVRAFVWMREALAAHQDLAHRLDDLERKYDAQFRVVFDAIRALMEPAKKPSRQIGF
jgi:hypothetical protein